MEILKNKSVEKKEKILFTATVFENKQTMLSHFENYIVLFGICSNCLNNSNCVWIEKNKIECEEYNLNNG